ncbi:MAG: hypothetical protein A3F11_03155 [Gammaproteobacteria bacterium RIFCSPHIGHO2_12_FULL_37_14]|nr:MAG: hypothetical protein A3F11_03155 [Gammaproteobacteria bacterium RIFCSPHIGHO2_12_FULL_37_14]
MRIKIPLPLGVFLPVCLLGFLGVSIIFLHSVLNNNTRWLYFGILLLYLTLKKKLISYWDLPLVLAFASYSAWCFFSSFWSDVPLLSFSKSIVLCFVIITMTSAGIEWIKTYSWGGAFNYLKLSVYVFIPTVLFGMTRDSSVTSYSLAAGTSVEVYTSLIRGANMLGFMMAAIFPVLLWELYKKWSNKKARILWGCALLICTYFLILAFSRSAIADVIVILGGFAISFNLTKKVLFVIVGTQIALVTLLVHPSIVSDIANTSKFYIYKTAIDDADVFMSRQLVWQQSYEAAKEGGLFGLGYGVSWGFTDFNFDHGLTSAAYGREKGNSQLAIIEETGWIGLILYVLLLGTVGLKLFKMYVVAHDEEHRVLLGIISGMFVGLIFTSFFEAWWGAPAGPETVYFWVLVGIIRGLEIAMGNNGQSSLRSLPRFSQDLSTELLHG